MVFRCEFCENNSTLQIDCEFNFNMKKKNDEIFLTCLVDDKICSKRLFIISILFWQAK